MLFAANAQQAYYPQQAGASWFYDSGEQVFLERVPSRTFDTFVNRDNITIDQVRVRVRRVGEVEIAREVLSFSDAGVFLHGSTAGALSLIYEPPLLLYPPAPLEVGLTWRSETDVQSVLRGSSESVPGVTRVALTGTVTGIQGIASPLGNFNTFVIEQVSVVDTGDAPTESVRVDYFLPTVGVVAFDEGEGMRVLEQTNFPIP
jgi:hypothetical protein